MSTTHLRPAPDTLSRTATSATWRNRRGHSFVALHCSDAPGYWDLYRIKLVEAEGVIDVDTLPALRDIDVVTSEELVAIIG